MVVVAIQRPFGSDQPAEGVTERSAARVADGEVIKPRAAWWRRTAAGGFPRVEPDVMVVAARGHEQRVRPLEHDVETEDVHVERAHPGEVVRLEVDVPDVDAGVDRSRCSLSRLDSRLEPRVAGRGAGQVLHVHVTGTPGLFACFHLPSWPVIQTLEN